MFFLSVTKPAICRIPSFGKTEIIFVWDDNTNQTLLNTFGEEILKVSDFLLF